MIAIGVHAASVGEWRKECAAKEAHLGAVGVAGKNKRRPSAEAFVKEIRMVRQENHRRPFGNVTIG